MPALDVASDGDWVMKTDSTARLTYLLPKRFAQEFSFASRGPRCMTAQQAVDLGVWAVSDDTPTVTFTPGRPEDVVADYDSAAGGYYSLGNARLNPKRYDVHKGRNWIAVSGDDQVNQPDPSGHGYAASEVFGITAAMRRPDGCAAVFGFGEYARLMSEAEIWRLLDSVRFF